METNTLNAHTKNKTTENPNAHSENQVADSKLSESANNLDNPRQHLRNVAFEKILSSTSEVVFDNLGINCSQYPNIAKYVDEEL